MNEKRAFSLRLILSALVVVSVVPAILVAAALVLRDYHVRRDQVYRDTVLTARGIIIDLDREIFRIESVLKVLATSGELAANNLSAFHVRALNALAAGDIFNFVLLDPEGRQKINTMRLWGDVLPTSGAPIDALTVLQSHATVVTSVFLGTLTKAPTVAICVPVFRGESVVYILCASVLAEKLTGTLTRQAMPSGWVAVALDKNARIMARTQDAERFIGRPAVPALATAILRSKEGTLESVTHDGVTVLTAFSRSDVSGWTVAAGAPEAVLVKELLRSLAWASAASAIVLALGIWLALYLASRVGSAVRGLIGPALSIGSHDAPELPRSVVMEVSALGDAIAQAAKRHMQVKHLAQHDALTGLCNRLLLEELGSQRIEVATRNKSNIAILAIDLDGFKAVNDRHGHAAGDKVLKIASERITACVRSADVRARIGGDEFIVLLEETTATGAKIVANKLMLALSERYPDVVPEVSGSIGVAIWPTSGRSLGELLARADFALYKAKRAGKRRVVFDGDSFNFLEAGKASRQSPSSPATN